MSKSRLFATLVGLFCLLAVPSAASAMKFAAPAGSPVTGLGYVSRTVSADFNGDGLADLATVSNGSHTGISIRLAQGDGTWIAAPSLDVSTVYDGYALAAGDVTGDGKPDLVEYRNAGQGLVLLPGNGDGTFASPAAIPLSNMPPVSSPRAMAIGDVTGDGKADILYGLSSGSYTISIGNGAAGFSNTLNAWTNVPGAPSGPSDRFTNVAIGDFNGDGKPDFALSMSPATLDDPSLIDVFVMLGDGAGNFTPASGNPVQISEPAGYTGHPDSMTTGNLNGDGATDLVVTTGPDGRGFISQGPGVVQAFFGNTASGLTAGPVLASSDNRPGPAVTGDFDKDGKTDIAWMERVLPNGPPIDQIQVERGNGIGTFSPAAGSPFEIATGLASTSDLTTADFNGDDALDFAAGYGSENAIRLLNNQIDPAAVPDSIDFGNLSYSTTAASEQFQISNLGGPDAQVASVTLTGTDSSKFTRTTNCVGKFISGTSGCTQTVGFTPNQPSGTYTANVHVTFASSSETLDVPVTATVQVPRVSYDPNPLDFGEVRVGQELERTVTITSSGDAPVHFGSGATISGADAANFVRTDDTCFDETIQPGDTCSVTVVAIPAATGRLDAVLDVPNTGPAGDQSIPISVEGVNPNVTVDPSIYFYGGAFIGESASHDFTINSTGTTPLRITGVTMVGDRADDFQIDNGCIGTFDPGESCHIQVTFSPQRTGGDSNRVAQLQIQADGLPGPKNTQVSGTALQTEVGFNPDELNFGDVPVGSSVSQTIQVSSDGDGPLHIDEAYVDGPDSDEFSISDDNCAGNSVPGGCSFKLTFTPTSRGDKEAWPGIIGSNVDASSLATGKGIQPAGKFDPSSIGFEDAVIGAASGRPTETFNLQSTGPDSLTIDSISITGADADSFKVSSNGCGTTLASGQSCPVEVTFDPQSGQPGKRTATLRAETGAGAIEATASGQAVSGTTPPLPTYKASLKVKGPKKVKVGKKAGFKVTVSSTGTGALSGAVLKYKATQGKGGKAKVKKTIKLPSISPGHSLGKTVKIVLPKKKFKKGKPVKITFTVVRQSKILASRAVTPRLDFGQAKVRRQRDVSSS